MNWFDLTLLAILSLSVIVSLFRGLIREVLSLLIWVGAFWLAWTFVDNGANWLVNIIDLPSARHLIAFVALFLAALIVGGMINYLVGKMITKTGLGATDRFFGMFFGLGRGVIAVTALILFLQATPFSKDPWWTESRLTPQFAKLADWVKQQMPEDMAAYFSFIDPEQLQKTLNPALINQPQNNGEEPVSEEADDQAPEPEPKL
jgi:membrane protein required for colicin V production